MKGSRRSCGTSEKLHQRQLFVGVRTWEAVFFGGTTGVLHKESSVLKRTGYDDVRKNGCGDGRRQRPQRVSDSAVTSNVPFRSVQGCKAWHMCVWVGGETGFDMNSPKRSNLRVCFFVNCKGGSQEVFVEFTWNGDESIASICGSCFHR